jgi:vacuolar iron transporter family protein
LESAVKQGELARILRNWQDERDSAALYDALAGLERNPRLSGLFRRLGESEREHCAYWEERMRSLGLEVPRFRASLRTRTMIGLARRLGVGFVLPRITTRELADHGRYASQEDASAAGLASAEREHAAVMRRIAAYGATLAERGPNVSAASLSNSLRAAVLGANDGLASNFCLIMGVAGGGASGAIIRLTGVAGLVAGACSMALGEWLSVTNSLEMARSQLDTDVRELHAPAAWQRKGLMLVYQAEGMAEEEAGRAADRVIAQDPDAISRLIHEERVMAAAHLGNSPASAAAVSFALFAAGAFVPLMPFLFATSATAVIASIACALSTLLTLGLVTSFFNGRSPLFAGLRQVIIGAAAAAVTYAAGRLVGSAVG